MKIQRKDAKMQRRKEDQLDAKSWVLIIALLAIAACLTGCVMSEAPFYLESQVVADPRIEGTFVNTNDNSTSWLVTHGKEGGKKYLVQITTEDTKYELIGTLFRLDNILFLDLFPSREMPSSNARGSASPISDFGHALMSEKKHLVVKVELADDGGTFWCPVPSTVGLAANRSHDLKLKMVGKVGILVLPSSTEESQKYLLRLANDSSVFISQNRLTKTK